MYLVLAYLCVMKSIAIIDISSNSAIITWTHQLHLPTIIIILFRQNMINIMVSHSNKIYSYLVLTLRVATMILPSYLLDLNQSMVVNTFLVEENSQIAFRSTKNVVLLACFRQSKTIPGLTNSSDKYHMITLIGMMKMMNHRFKLLKRSSQIMYLQTMSWDQYMKKSQQIMRWRMS